MEVQSFIRVLEEHYTVFRALFAESVVNPSEEVIHCMRRELKYIFAMIHFIEDLSPMNDLLSITNPLKRIAKKSGKVRDRQIILNLMETHPQVNNSPLLDEINATILTKQQKYSEFAQEIEINKFIFGNLSIDPISFNRELFADYCNRMEHRIAEMLARGIENREYWHKARHISKRNFHIMNMANRLYPNCFSQDQIQEMRQTEKLIGKWHDLVVITDFCDSHQIALSEAHLQEFELSENQIFSKAILKN